MTVATTSRLAGPFTGTGADAVLAFTFKVLAVTDVEVVRDNVVLVLNSDYTVALNLDQENAPGGSVTVLAASNTFGSIFYVTTAAPESQPTSLPAQNIWSPKIIEGALDRIAILLQQLRATVSRGFIMPFGKSGLSLSPDDKGVLLGTDVNGNATSYPTSSFKGDPGSAGEGYSTRSALAAAGNTATNLDDAYLTETGREGKFVWNNANHSAHVTADPNQGLYVAPSSDPTGASGAWVRQNHGNAASVADILVPLATGSDSATKTANLAAITGALDTLSSLFGGGTIRFPQGTFYFSDEIPVGDGTNTSQSTKHHNIRIVGAGKGSSPSVSNVQTLAPTVLRYGGSADTTKAVINLKGPLHGIQIENIELDANGLAGIGLKTNHVDDFVYRNVIVRNWTTNSYVFTTRTGFTTGVGHGCGNGSLYDCYAYDPASNSANGLLLTSGVSTATTLVGNPDTANMDIYGGVFFYGGSTGTSGIEFAGCDNNSYNGTQFIPAGGNDGGGHSHKWTQWPGSTWFPGGNQLRQGGFSQGMTGTAGTGGNMAWFDNSDSGYIPSVTGLSVQLADGSRYVNGQRSYSVYSISTAQLNFSTQTTTSATIVDVPGLVLPLTYPAGSKLRLSFTGVAAKDTTGTGDFYLNHNGSDYGPSLARIEATGYAASVASELLIDLPSAGSAVNAKVRFQSDGTNALHIQNASFIATVLY